MTHTVRQIGTAVKRWCEKRVMWAAMDGTMTRRSGFSATPDMLAAQFTRKIPRRGMRRVQVGTSLVLEVRQRGRRRSLAPGSVWLWPGSAKDAELPYDDKRSTTHRRHPQCPAHTRAAGGGPDPTTAGDRDRAPALLRWAARRARPHGR